MPLNTYQPNEATGLTAYQFLHGQPASEKLAYFGERVFFLTPKRRRSNLDLRWSTGVCLGTLMVSNEALIGLPGGDVVRSRSVARLLPNQKWNREAVLAVKGTPAKPSVGPDDSSIESFYTPPPAP